MRFWNCGCALLILLTVGTTCRANVPTVVYKDDPGYERARTASRVAPLMVPAFLGLAVLWAAFDRSRSGRAAAVGFSAVVLLAGAVTLLGSGGTRFPDETPDSQRPIDKLLRQRGSPREATPEETALGGLTATALLCFGGLTLARRSARREASEGRTTHGASGHP